MTTPYKHHLSCLGGKYDFTSRQGPWRRKRGERDLKEARAESWSSVRSGQGRLRQGTASGERNSSMCKVQRREAVG